MYSNRKERTIELGKIDYQGCGKRNLATLKIALYEADGKPAFAASGNIWMTSRRDILHGGQCLDTLMEYQSDLKPEKREILNRVYRLWKKHHLNDLNAGTPEQEAALEGVEGDYKEQCRVLEEKGLLVVKRNGKPYKYGSAWIYREIPPEDLAEIKELMSMVG